MSTSVLIVTELGGRRRQLSLVGAALPFMGAAWGGSLVMSTSWNPGNPNATQQVLVPTESPSAWEGEWNTNRLAALPPQYSEAGGADQSIVLADTLRSVIEDIFRSGQQLSVTWIYKDNRRITRFGRAKTWNFPHRGGDDIKWSITFEWSGRGISQPTVSPDEGTIAAVRAATLAANDAAGHAEAQSIISANKQHPLSANRFTLGQLESLAGAPQQLVKNFTRLATAVTNRLRHVTDILVKVRDQPAAVAGLALSAATDAVATANDFCDRMGRQGPEQQSLDSRVSALLRASRYYGSAQTQAELMSMTALRLARLARARHANGRPSAGNPSSLSSGDMLATYLPKKGDTMISISRKFYGGDDLSYELSRANALPGSTIVPPRAPALIIPQRAILEGRRGT